MTNILFIGSLAASVHGYKRAIKDTDFIASYEDGIKYMKAVGVTDMYPQNQGKKIIGVKTTSDGSKRFFEHEIAWADSTSERLLKHESERNASSVPKFATHADLVGQYASLDSLYTLKLSHRYRKNSPHFRKTMADIHAMRAAGAKVPDSLQDWLRDRERETYDYGHPKLNQSKSEFFSDDGIDYRYDHDSIHLAIKQMEQPAYNYFKPDAAEVFCSKDMFFSCADEIRLNAVYEETAVLALERSIIPHAGVLTPEQAFTKSLEKVCTSITSGWFREYAWENHARALDLYHTLDKQGRNYTRLFEQGLENGIVLPYSK